MTISRDLLSQARALAKRERGRPTQATLRRAGSTAYYSLFHFIGEECAKRLTGSGPADRRLRDLARRAIAHTKLKDVTAEFAKPSPRGVLKTFWASTTGLDPLRIIGDPDFKTLANSVAALQELRHQADYDFSRNFTRQQVLDACDQAEAAMDAWKHLKSMKPDASKLLALTILLWPGLSGRT